MLSLLNAVLTFPTVVYTALLCVVTIYWLFVVVGGISVNLFGGGAADGVGADGGLEGAAKGTIEGVAKGAIEGVAKGAIEGVAKGAIEGVAKGAIEGGADVLHTGGGGFGYAGHAEIGHAEVGHAEVGHAGVAHDGAGHGASHSVTTHGGVSSLLAALKLRSAPATVVLSLIVTFSWLLCTLAMQSLPPSPAALRIPLGVLVLLASPVLALLPTSILVRPLGRLFILREGTTRRDLVGKVCRVRTGTVNERFGEATVEGGGAELVVRVRVSPHESLRRGEQALIVDFDEQRDAFVVAPLRDVLDERAS